MGMKRASIGIAKGHKETMLQLQQAIETDIVAIAMGHNKR